MLSVNRGGNRRIREVLFEDAVDPDFEEALKSNRPFDGFTFVVTGTLPGSRKEVEELIESMGGHASGSVSKKTDYLVLGESPGSKFDKAQTLGVKTISYDQLIKMSKEEG